MSKAQIQTDYHNWLVRLVSRKNGGGRSYQKLFNCLDDIPFRFQMEMDGNRAYDGMALRYHFAEDNGYPNSEIDRELGSRFCSMLEMMAGLALRCEENIMQNTLYGNRTPKWFWVMARNMGLDQYDDIFFDEREVRRIVDRVLNRDYAPNGRGGYFITEKNVDVRNVEIWYQAMWYLDTVIENGEEFT